MLLLFSAHCNNSLGKIVAEFAQAFDFTLRFFKFPLCRSKFMLQFPYLPFSAVQFFKMPFPVEFPLLPVLGLHGVGILQNKSLGREIEELRKPYAVVVDQFYQMPDLQSGLSVLKIPVCVFTGTQNFFAEKFLGAMSLFAPLFKDIPEILFIQHKAKY